MRVVLPAPFSPSRASISPWARVREMSSLALSAPKFLVMPESFSKGVMDMIDRKKGAEWFRPPWNQKVDLGSSSLISMTRVPALMAGLGLGDLGLDVGGTLSSKSWRGAGEAPPLAIMVHSPVVLGGEGSGLDHARWRGSGPLPCATGRKSRPRPGRFLPCSCH